MRKQGLQILVLLLSIVLVVVLTLSVLSLIDPIVFWVLAGLSAIFAYKILPKMQQQQGNKTIK
jgi:hypothetical protein